MPVISKSEAMDFAETINKLVVALEDEGWDHEDAVAFVIAMVAVVK